MRHVSVLSPPFAMSLPETLSCVFRKSFLGSLLVSGLNVQFRSEAVVPVAPVQVVVLALALDGVVVLLSLHDV